jgi:anti-sigma factor RsiW
MEGAILADHDCRELLTTLSDYVDGDLDPQICAQIEVHVDGCTNCRTVIETLKGTITLYHALPDHRLSPDAADRLCAALGLDAGQSE